jgi:type IV pilus assembly protein PilB
VPVELWSPGKAAARRSVEQLLLERGQISESHLVQARQVAAQTPGKSLVQILLGMQAASEAQILAAVAETLNLPFETPDKSKVDARAFEQLPNDYVRKHGVLPIRFEGENDRTLVVGMTDPNNVFLIDEVRRKTRKDLRVVVVTPADVNKVAEGLMSGNSDMKVDDIIKDMAEDDVQLVKESAQDDATDLEKRGSESPVIRFVNYLIFDAIKQGASDIHIEPKEKALKIRYRIDGILFEAMSPPHTMHPAIVSRLKIMANLDISERRRPPGRPHPRRRAQPQDRPPPQHAPVRQRREGRHAHPGQPVDQRLARRPRVQRERPDDLEDHDRPAARHRAGHRPDRVG